MKDFAATSELLQNPFTSIFYWVKGQVDDIKAMRDALVSRDNILHVIQKIKTKKANVQKELNKTIKGRTTLKTFFKSSNEKASFIQQLTDFEGRMANEGIGALSTTFNEYSFKG